METFAALLAICAENSPIPGEFTAQRGWRHRAHYNVIVIDCFGVMNYSCYEKHLSQKISDSIQKWGLYFIKFYEYHFYPCELFILNLGWIIIL